MCCSLLGLLHTFFPLNWEFIIPITNVEIDMQEKCHMPNFLSLGPKRSRVWTTLFWPQGLLNCIPLSLIRLLLLFCLIPWQGIETEDLAHESSDIAGFFYTRSADKNNVIYLFTIVYNTFCNFSFIYIYHQYLLNIYEHLWCSQLNYLY